QVNVGQVNRFPETIRVVKSNLLAVLVEPIPFAIVIENGPENPAMTVKVSKLRGLHWFVEFGAAHILEELFVAPKAANRSAFWIAFERFIALLFRRMALLFRIHFVAIDFVVP